jgi:hypothetical protein
MQNEIFKVPDFKKLFLPILKQVKQEYSTVREVRNQVAKSFGISAKNQLVSVPIGSKNSFQANFDIALSWLKKCEFVEQELKPKPANPKKVQAVVSLTPEGVQAMLSGEIGELPAALKNRDLSNEIRKGSQRANRSKIKGAASAALKPRRANILGAEKSIISSISEANLQKLFTLWMQNVRRVGDPTQRFKHAAAKRIIVAVEKEWDRRLPYIRLNSDHFIWPSTEASKGIGSFEIGLSPEVGMLAYMEYRVGHTNGQPVGVRRAILDRVVKGTLPLYGGTEYYDEWGKPDSVARLQKLAEAIAAFTRNAKRRGKTRLADAISEWEADLEYLHTVYYLPRFGFGWPST